MTLRERWGWAWVTLCLALAVHVADEAAHDFVTQFYLPRALALRARTPWLPVPIFTVQSWLATMTVAVAAVLALSPFAFRGAGWMRAVSIGFALLMLANGAGHVLISLSWGRPMPGVLSSPILIAASLWLMAAQASSEVRPERRSA